MIPFNPFFRRWLPGSPAFSALLLESLVTHYQSAANHVMQAALAIRECNHDETNAHDPLGEYFGEKPARGSRKRNPVTQVVGNFQPQYALADRCLP